MRLLPSTSMLPFLLVLLSSLLPSVSAQAFGGFNFPTSASTTSTSTTSISTTSTHTSASATSTGVYGQCADTCITQNPVVNHCNGTETGSALDRCKCKSYKTNEDPLVNCILSCPSDQQLNFAKSLPKLCAQVLFLFLDLSGKPKPSAINSAAAASFNATQVATVRAAAQATATPSSNAGVAVGTGANVLGLLGVTLGIAAFL